MESALLRVIGLKLRSQARLGKGKRKSQTPEAVSNDTQQNTPPPERLKYTSSRPILCHPQNSAYKSWLEEDITYNACNWRSM